MSQSINIVTNSLEHYDKNIEKYDKLISKIKYYELIQNDSDLEHSKIKFYDRNKKLLFETRYEIIGLYSNVSSTWIWAWSVPFFKKNSTFISKNILKYGLDIPSSPENKFLKSELITSRFRISDKVQLDLHVSIASYISKKPMVYKLIYKPERIGEEGTFEVFDEPTDDNNYVIMYLFLLDYEKLV